MRVPEISLVNGLHAQNKHDLCRTISIQNDIDKLNTFQLTQFHLWWCQVCRAWEFSKFLNKINAFHLIEKRPMDIIWSLSFICRNRTDQ